MIKNYLCESKVLYRIYYLENTGEILWLDGLSHGDDSAFRKLFDDYFYPLSSFAGKYLEDRQAAEDIVQDVFFEYWQKRTAFRDITSFKSYFYTVVRNRCIDVLKRHKVKDRYLSEQNNIKDQTDFFLHQIFEEEVYRSLRDAIESLPESTRRIYDLSLLGYDNEQIAEMLDMTLDSVKSRKKRGKQLLQEKLQNLMSLLLPLL